MTRLLVLALLVSSPALAAAPKTGDTAVYDVHTTQVPDQTGTLTWAVGTFDQNANTANIGQTLQFLGRTQASNVQSSYQALTQADLVVAQCEAVHGVREGLDVPAGHFDTCRITEEDDKAIKTAWFGTGVTVFGFVKFTQLSKADNVTVEFDLRSSSPARH